MVAVIHRTTLQFLPSANEPDYPEPTWKWSPDMTQVVGVAAKYWKWDAVAERPVPMTQAEQDAVDAAALSAQRTAAMAQLTQTEDVLRAFMLVVLDEVNILRSAASLSARTETQLRNAIRNKLGS